MIEISVVIPTYNRKQMLRECLASLFCQDFAKDKYEIIVIDDGSSDGTEELVNNLIKTSPVCIRYFKQGHIGAAGARNLGVENAQGQIIAFTDDDCIIDKYWLRNLLQHLNHISQIDACAGVFLGDPAHGSIQKDREGFFSDLHSPDTPGTANFAIKRELFLNLGGFDTGLFNIEDKDLFIRLLKAGYKIYVEDRAKIYHKPRAKLNDLFRQQYGYGFEDPIVFKKNFRNRLVLRLGRRTLVNTRCVFPAYVRLDFFNCLLTLPFVWIFLENKSVSMIICTYVCLCAKGLGNLRGSLRNKVLFYGP